MKRVIIKFSDGNYVNIQGDDLAEDGEYIRIFNGKNILVGVVKMDDIVAVYISEKS